MKENNEEDWWDESEMKRLGEGKDEEMVKMRR